MPVKNGSLLNHILYQEGYLEKLITDNYGEIYRYCCLRLDQRQAAEDITQEVFLKFLDSLDSYKDYGKVRNYLYVIAGNLIKNYHKKPRETCAGEIEDGEAAPDGTDRVVDRVMVQEALSALEKTEKDIVILRYYQDLRIKDISRIMGMPASTVRYRLKAAEQILREKLKNEDGARSFTV